MAPKIPETLYTCLRIFFFLKKDLFFPPYALHYQLGDTTNTHSAKHRQKRPVGSVFWHSESSALSVLASLEEQSTFVKPQTTLQDALFSLGTFAGLEGIRLT